ncbi:antibiotic biosynthesis monooxygenase [Nocardiopsis gilva YIM 90087]|uniref:Antibiotic biosynthesis monooxygenase n=1 Tax=Nocardiopsis gilva YIM 90087 TaxID=1235441 RepID=A0A223SDN4_9ACTN|nr:antibiotic biosynthesis monooxygenase family protein [Nocardiopsis gilva]ASU86264.1 antibiotic biosynthesis monooxygenase [Nocardiopsis gilva YIM 90087]
MLIVAGHIEVDPGERAAYLEGCRGVVEQARSAAGCWDFALSPDLVEPGRINVYERWERAEDLERFRGSGPTSEQQAAIVGASVARYVISAVEAP